MSNSNFTRKGCAIIISGPSGSGKTTLSNKLLDDFEDIEVSISVTTRKMRDGEIDGHDYYFIDKKTFSSLLLSGQILEHTELYGNFYGTQKKPINEKLDSGADVLFDVDTKGAKALKHELGKDAITIFIMPPSMIELRKRLQLRSTENQVTLEKRIKAATGEIKKLSQYDYVIINDNVDKAYAKMNRIIESERNKCFRIKNLSKYINDILEN